MKKKPIREGIIWRQSVYSNRFKCQLCGCQLANPETGEPTDNIVLNAEGLDVDNRLFCGNCQKNGTWNIVATHRMVVSDESGLQGNWSDKVEKYEKEFEKAEEYVKQLKVMTKTLNKKMSEISEMESKIAVLENRCKNKDAEIEKYSKKVQSLTKENENLEHRLDELTELLQKRND